jgi:F-type H+-transporting ATPase subunit b
MLAASHIPIASSGSFLITPNVGLMVWTIVVFVISLLILRRWVFPLIGQALDRPLQSCAWTPTSCWPNTASV